MQIWAPKIARPFVVFSDVYDTSPGAHEKRIPSMPQGFQLASNNIGWVEVESLLAGQAPLDCAGALVCEHLFFSCLDRIERLRRNVLWGNLLHVKALGHVRVHESDVRPPHLRPFLA
jgi:hypothetical protein